MEKKFIAIMIFTLLLLLVALGVRIATGPGINFNSDGGFNLTLPEFGGLFNDAGNRETQGDIAANNDDRFVLNMRLSSPHPMNDGGTMAMEWAVHEIYYRTNGAINITHFPSGQLGDEDTVREGAKSGNIDIVVVSLPVAFDNRIGILFLPHFATCYEDGLNMWTYGSNTFAILSEVVEEQNLKLMGILPGGLHGIGTYSPFNPETVWDFDQPSHELIIRIFPAWIFETIADAKQLRVKEIESRSELRDAFFAGTVDGWMGGSPHENSVNYHHLINYFYDFKTVAFFRNVLMNKDTYYLIPEEYRQIIFEVMQEASVQAINARATLSAGALQVMTTFHGITVITPTDEERQQMREAMSRRLWPKFVKEFEVDQYVFERVLQDIRY